MKLSIIVPVYRVEKYLRQCVDSVLNQSFRDWELILVDDGSPDACPQICDEYAAQDPRVKVIHKANGGLSSARNAGTEAATGDYVLFLDSDDWLSRADAVELLVRRVAVSGADVVSFAYSKIYESTGERIPCLAQPRSMPENCASKEQQLRYLTGRGLYIASACNKLIRLACIKENGLSFPVGKTSEDIAWCLKLLLAAESLDFCKEDLYCYRQREGSISQTLDHQKCVQLTEQILECARLARSAGDDGALRYAAYQFATFMKVQTFSEYYAEDCVARLKPYAELLRYHAGNRKLLALRGMTLLLGYPLSCRILYAALRLKRRTA